MAKNTVFRVYKDEETMLNIYKRRLGMADTFFEKVRPAKEAFLARYRQDAEVDQVTDRGHVVSVSTGVGVVDTLYSSMTAVDIEFIAKNIGNGTPEQAVAATRALNQGFRDTKAQQRLKKSIKDAVLLDIGWCKVYYDYVEDVDLQERPVEALRAQADELREQRPDITDEELEDILADSAMEEVEVVLRDRVCVDYVPWDCVRYDPSAKQMEDVRWVAQYTKLPIDEVRFHPQWKEFVHERYGVKRGDELLDDITGDTNVLAGLEGSYDDISALGSSEEEDDQRVTVVEMWDMETGLVTTFPKNRNDLILFQRTNPLMFNLDLEDRNPFKSLVVREDPDRLEGLGDMRVVWTSLQELDEYRNLAARYAAMPSKVFGPANALTPQGRKALESQTVGEYVGLEANVGKDQVGTIESPQLPTETFELMQTLQFEMKEATGASEPMRGVFPSRRTTATETEIVQSAGEQRQAERRGALEVFYLSVAKTMLQLMQLFYDRERMLRYTDDLGNEFVWQWNKTDIAMDADLEISLTPRENLTRPERVQRALMWMNLALPLEETDRGELMRFVAREMGFRDEDVRAMVRGDEEAAEKASADQLAAEGALAVKPQPFGNSPQGLTIGTTG